MLLLVYVDAISIESRALQFMWAVDYHKEEHTWRHVFFPSLRGILLNCKLLTLCLARWMQFLEVTHRPSEMFSIRNRLANACVWGCTVCTIMRWAHGMHAFERVYLMWKLPWINWTKAYCCDFFRIFGRIGTVASLVTCCLLLLSSWGRRVFNS